MAFTIAPLISKLSVKSLWVRTTIAPRFPYAEIVTLNSVLELVLWCGIG
jgi:hypothetical protein